MKIVRYDKGGDFYKKYDEIGEYYEKYDEIGQCMSSFVKFLEKHDICATILGTTQQDIVAEWHNHTLLDMVTSMLSNSSLLI